MDAQFLRIGDEVANSGVGPGKVTGFHQQNGATYPEVNGKAVGRLTRGDGAVYGPLGNLALPDDLWQPAPQFVRPLGLDGNGLPTRTDTTPQPQQPQAATATPSAPAGAPATPATPASTPTPASAPVAPASSPSAPASAPVAPASSPSTPASAPVAPASSPSTPSAPVAPASSPSTPSAPAGAPAAPAGGTSAAFATTPVGNAAPRRSGSGRLQQVAHAVAPMSTESAPALAPTSEATPSA